MRFGWNLASPEIGLGFWLLLVWSMAWKGLALWRAAKEDSMYWFIAVFILNTMGLLEIAYLFFFAKEKLSLSGMSAPKPKSRKKK